MRYKFRHPFARFGGETQQPGIGFQNQGDIDIAGGGTSHYVKVTLDSELISELEVRQVNDRSDPLILNDKLESTSGIPNGAQIPLVRRTGVKTWEFRTVAKQGSAENIGNHMIEAIARIYGPTGEVIWEKGFGKLLDSQAKLNANVPEVVRSRGGWGMGTGSDGQPHPRRPNRVGSSNNRWTLNTGMTPEKLAALMPDIPTDDGTGDGTGDGGEEDGALTTGEKVAVGAGFGTALLVLLFGMFSMFGGKRKP